MAKKILKPGTMVAPVPAVLVSCADKTGNDNLLTIAWTGTINSDPPMAYISVRPDRFSHHMISETGEFVINLTTKEMTKGVDVCGVTSGREINKWKLSGFTKAEASAVKAPVVAESPLNIECKVKQVISLGSHDMFLAEIAAIQADDRYFDENGKFDLCAAGLTAYVNGTYTELGEKIGTFGYSVRKKSLTNRVKADGTAKLPVK